MQQLGEEQGAWEKRMIAQKRIADRRNLMERGMEQPQIKGARAKIRAREPLNEMENTPDRKRSRKHSLMQED